MFCFVENLLLCIAFNENIFQIVMNFESYVKKLPCYQLIPYRAYTLLWRKCFTFMDRLCIQRWQTIFIDHHVNHAPALQSFGKKKIVWVMLWDISGLVEAINSTEITYQVSFGFLKDIHLHLYTCDMSETRSNHSLWRQSHWTSLVTIGDVNSVTVFICSWANFRPELSKLNVNQHKEKPTLFISFWMQTLASSKQHSCCFTQIVRLVQIFSGRTLTYVLTG